MKHGNLGWQRLTPLSVYRLAPVTTISICPRNHVGVPVDFRVSCVHYMYVPDFIEWKWCLKSSVGTWLLMSARFNPSLTKAWPNRKSFLFFFSKIGGNLYGNGHKKIGPHTQIKLILKRGTLYLSLACLVYASVNYITQRYLIYIKLHNDIIK